MNRILKKYANLRLWSISIGLGLFFTLFELVGNSFEQMGSLVLVLGNKDYILQSFIKGFFLLLIFSMVNASLYLLLEYLGKGKPDETKHSFLTYFFLVVITWLPILIIFYPGTTNIPVTNEIFSYFGIANETTRRINLISDTVMVNGHHSVFHTLLLGWSVSLGRFLGSDTFGLFIYTGVQYVLFAAILAGVLKFLEKLSLNKWLRRGVLLVYLFFPVFPLRVAISLNKDELYSVLYLLFVLLCTQLITDSEGFLAKKKNWVFFVLTLIFVMLIRRNGLYALLLTAPFLIMVVKKGQRVKFSVLLILVVLFFTVVVSDVIYPMCAFTPGSKSSALAVPFQQTARYKKLFEAEITQEEYEAINGVLEYEEIKYRPERANGVLPIYRKDATKEDLKAYFKVWFQMFLKHPLVYIEATLNNSYGYFYPQTYRKEIMMEGISAGSNHGGDFDFHNPEVFDAAREAIYQWSLELPKIPVVRLFFTTGIYTWIAMFLVGFLLYTKTYRYIIAFIPLALNVLICMASPVNTMLRYMLPVVICIPFLFGVCIHEAGVLAKEKEETK